MSQLYRIILGCIFSLLFIVIPAKAQKEAEVYNVDSSLYAYYQRCQENLLEPVVLSMSDTLFHMAAEQNDQRMQAVALSTRLDYYYYQGNNEDSVVFHTSKVKQFAKETLQPKYYYFAWANRLILYYLKTGRSNIALYEAEKMLKEAQEEDNKTGLLYCYNIMSQIYTIKNFDVMASEWRQKEIELTEKYKLENYNISNTYAQLASYYTTHHQPELAVKALEKAVRTANSASHKILAKLAYVDYYSESGDFPAAEKMLKECRELFDQDKRLDSLKKRFYRTESFYYQRSKQFVKALEATEKQEAEEQRLNEYAMNGEQYRIKGEIYKQMGRPEEAIKFLQKYIRVDDSLKIANERLASSEFATLLNVEKLNAEKKELMLQAKEKELSNKTTLIISLIILLGILFLFLYREGRLNRKLKTSESELKIKNEELTHSREELRKARDLAEANSQMKTTFIQSMSHEIRTPLNSIIGFSQVLSDHYGNEETKEFVNIIKANTDDLLRLVTDVLTLSELDQYDKLPTDIRTDINIVCQMSIEAAGVQERDTVAFHFRPERENLIILSNPAKIRSFRLVRQLQSLQKKSAYSLKKVEQEFFHGIYLQGYILSGLPYALNRRFSSLSVIGITVP